MKRLLETTSLLLSASALLGTLAAVPLAAADDEALLGTPCTLSAIDLVPIDSGTRLDLTTQGSPTSLGTRVEPENSIVLDLSGCIPGPQLTGRTFATGLIGALELVHRSGHSGPVTALVIKTRQAFEYSVSSRQGGVQVLLRPDEPPQTAHHRETDGRSETASRPKTSAIVGMSGERIRVMEPLPLQPPPVQPTPVQPTSPQPPPVQPLSPQSVAQQPSTIGATTQPEPTQQPSGSEPAPPPGAPSDVAALLEGARQSIARAPRYDPSYRAINYPGGDPGWERGSGVDLVVRAYRNTGADLQQLIHEDILGNASDYGVRYPDTHIDHRRVRNVALFLSRHGRSLPVDPDADWQAGDVVVWARDDKKPNHLGIVSDQRGASGHRQVIHHLQDQAPSEDDVLFAWPVRARYRWLPAAAE
ncbi:MAG: DUF1287 domain-containing protein [Acidobacteriota bacterium]